jgi:hypothetical protein
MLARYKHYLKYIYEFPGNIIMMYLLKVYNRLDNVPKNTTSQAGYKILVKEKANHVLGNYFA